MHWIGILLVIAACASISTPNHDNAEARQAQQEVLDEIQVGREMAAKLLGHFGHVKDPALTEYVNLVGQTLVRRSGRPELKYHFAVLDLAEVGAFAAPGGYIFVTRGMLMRVFNEAELAGVLAHEIAHVNGKHLYDQIREKHDVSAGESVARMMSRGGSTIGAALSKMVTRGMEILTGEGLSKELELAADREGTFYLASAGYPASALNAVVARLIVGGAIVQTKAYPTGTDRLEKLRLFLKENGFSDLKSTWSEAVAKQRFQKAVRASVISPYRKRT